MRHLLGALLMIPCVLFSDQEINYFLSLLDKNIQDYNSILDEMESNRMSVDDLQSEREKMVFFSGCLSSMESLKYDYVLYETLEKH